MVGCLSDAENVAINARLMQQSQDDATKVALERLGYAVTAAIAGGDRDRGVPRCAVVRDAATG